MGNYFVFLGILFIIGVSSDALGISPLADISELNLPKSCVMSFPNGKDDLMNFEVSIRPDDGYYL
jgi:hypothetical protein